MIIISFNLLLLKVQVRTSGMGLISWALVGNGLSGAVADPCSQSLHYNKLPGGSGRSLPGSALHFTDDTNDSYTFQCSPTVANHMLTDP